MTLWTNTTHTKAAHKECQDETGLIAQNIKHYCTTHAGATIEWDLYYFIVDKFVAGSQKPELGEVIKPEWKTFDEVKTMCLNGDIKEDRTVGVLLRFLISS
ncbi:MAG: hypothetical protein ABIG95_01510 [Candidatus Woesearchaeota archaeon]